MTLKRLKRHMDRRFDRLETTKADKADLRRFATKDYIRRRFATKDDLETFSSRVDTKFGRIDAQFAGVDNQFREVTRRLDSLNDKIDSVLKTAQQSLQIAQHGLDQVRQTDKNCFQVLHDHEDRLQALEGRTAT